MKKYKYGVVHGRFQPFHNDHLRYVLAAFEKSEILYIGITNPDPSAVRFDPADPKRSATDANPFTFYERMEMIRKSLIETVGDISCFRIVPFPINIPELLKHYTPEGARYFLTIYDKWGEKKLSDLKNLGFDTEVLWRKEETAKNMTATQIREGIINHKSWTNLVPNGTKEVVENILLDDPNRFVVNGRKKGKTYIVIVDGGADRPIHEFGNKTPFEQAVTPNMDRLAKMGRQGLISIINETIPPESDNGTMAILSYDPLVFYTGRGPLEGLGADFTSLNGDNTNTICFRVNFASYDECNSKLERRTARDLSDQELQSLTQELRNKINLDDFNVKFNIISFGRHRGIVSLSCSDRKMSGNISNTDPGFTKVGAFGIPRNEIHSKPLDCKALDDSEASRFSAKVVNSFIARAYKILSSSKINKKRMIDKKLPANILLMRDAGDMPKTLIPFNKKFGRSLSMYGQIPAERGLALLLKGNFNYVKMPEHKDEIKLLKDTVKLIVEDKSDIVCLHILKSADEAGHGGCPKAKTESIERFDKFFLGELLKNINETDSLIITCDHATPCELGIHSSDKVPVLIYYPGITPDKLNSFGENFAKDGGLNLKKAVQILPYFFEVNKKGE
ncbi:MAG: hypothetical protein K5766_03565 [Alphaproteobacteria bacterium]|nr:hypothetical protein [Alphaproteobacteria bacterium]